MIERAPSPGTRVARAALSQVGQGEGLLTPQRSPKGEGSKLKMGLGVVVREATWGCEREVGNRRKSAARRRARDPSRRSG